VPAIDSPDDEKVRLVWLVLEERRANQVVVQRRDRLAGMDEAEHLEGRLVGSFEQKRLANFELRRLTGQRGRQGEFYSHSHAG
jgi:hypothetical protein